MLKKTLAIAGKLLVAPALLLIVSPGISSAQNQCPIQQAKLAAAQKTMKVSIAAPAEKDIVEGRKMRKLNRVENAVKFRGKQY